MSQQMIPIWSPADYAEVLERAQAETKCPAALISTVLEPGRRFACDNPDPHHEVHTSAALRARWVDSGVS